MRANRSKTINKDIKWFEKMQKRKKEKEMESEIRAKGKLAFAHANANKPENEIRNEKKFIYNKYEEGWIIS